MLYHPWRMRLIHLVALAGIVSLVAVFGGVAGAHDANKGAKVQVGDDFFNPTKVSIAKGTKVKFKWIGTDKHNVVKKKGPGRLVQLRAPTDQTGFKYKHKFKKAGTYKLICTVHDDMKMKIKVKADAGVRISGPVPARSRSAARGPRSRPAARAAAVVGDRGRQRLAGDVVLVGARGLEQRLVAAERQRDPVRDVEAGAPCARSGPRGRSRARAPRGAARRRARATARPRGRPRPRPRSPSSGCITRREVVGLERVLGAVDVDPDPPLAARRLGDVAGVERLDRGRDLRHRACRSAGRAPGSWA